jgi:CO/xanthine dehydrogenase Mo-binding subunit
MGYIGKSVIRKDAYDKATGNTKYIADFKMPDMVYIATVRSPYPHAEIISIDSEEAQKEKGFVGIVTARDIPGQNIVPLVKPDWPFLAEKKVKFVGEPVALVVATNKNSAYEIAKKVKVKYKELPYELDPEKSLENKVQISGEDNILSSHKVRKGNVEQGFSESDLILEERFTTPYQEHAYLETQGMVAYLESDTVTVMGSMQCPFYVHDAVAQILGLSKNRVRVVQAPTGGGFGGKEDMPSLLAGHASLVAYLFKRPAKLIYERDEDLAVMSKRHPSVIYYKIGVKNTGEIKAIQVKYILDGGAYATLSPIVLWRGTVHAAGPYRCDNIHVDSLAAATNKLPCGAYRGFGQPQVAFAQESMIDEIAKKLNKDPIEYRKEIALRSGDTTATGQVLDESSAMLDSIEAAVSKKEEVGFLTGSDAEYFYGTGVSCVFYGVGLGGAGRHLDRAGAFVEIFNDASVNVSIGNIDMGQGAETVISQIAASALGCKYEDVHFLRPDTTRVPDSGPTVASRTTVMSGNAVVNACTTLKKRLLNVLSEMTDKPVEKLDLEDGWAYIDGKKSEITFSEVAKQAHAQRIHLANQGWFVSPHTEWLAEKGKGHAYITYSWATNLINIKVSKLTGEISVVKAIAAIDVGQAINPQQVEGQIEGGALQGIGYALLEEIIHKPDGTIFAPNFSGYHIPTIQDIPEEFYPIIVEKKYPKGPFGAKGFGEVPLIGMAPAIANALHDAIHKRFTYLPLKPENVLRAMVPCKL